MGKYMVYYCYENLSILDSYLALLNELEISFIVFNDCEYYGGYWGKLINEDKFFLANAFNIAKASSCNCDLLILEEDAFYNTILAKQYIEENPSLFMSIQNMLSNYGLHYNQETKVIFVNELLMQNLDSIDSKIKIKFSDFSASVFHSSKNEFYVNRDNSLFNLIDLKILYDDRNTYFQYESFNPSLSYKYSAKSLEMAFDLGSDFIIANSIGVFDMFDKKRNKISKAINKDFLDIPVLFLSQVILLAFGIKDDTKLAFRYHKIPVSFI